MDSPSPNALDARVYPPDWKRIVVLATAVSIVYGSGFIAAIWAAYISVQAAHADKTIPFGPWAIAIFLILSGMLGVVYGFFFRPRNLTLTRSKVSFVLWYGTGKSLKREEVESIESTGSKIILRGAGKTMVIGRMFSPWNELRDSLLDWAGKR